MHPILFNLGPIRLPTYGALMVTALLVGLWTAVRLGRREGLASNRLFDFSTWLIVVALVGAKLLMVLTNWSYYSQYPGQLFSSSTFLAGGVFYGGFAAAVFFALWYTRRYKLPVRKVFDLYSPAVALGLGIGRLGCFAAGCDYGKPVASSALSVVFTDPRAQEITGVPLGIPLHPTQLYESLASVLIFGYLVWLFGRKRYDGQVFIHYLVTYAVARFGIEFLRGDEDRGFVFGQWLSTSQFIALLALGTAAVLAVYFRSRRADAQTSEPAVPAAKRVRN